MHPMGFCPRPKTGTEKSLQSLHGCGHGAVGLLTPHEHRAALRMLAEVGTMLGQWIKTAKGNGRAGK